MSTDHDVIIIGAGPSGSLAAALLLKRGYRPLVLEQSEFPRFAIGESLLPQCMAYIEEAGMLEAVQAAAPRCGFQYKDGAVFNWGEQRATFHFQEKFSEGPGTTYQVRRAEFDKLLADEAQSAGADLRYRHAITGVDFSGDFPQVTAKRLDDDREQTWRCRFVLDASGAGRVLPRLLGLDRPSDFPVRQAIFTHVEDRIASPDFDRNKILITVHPDHPEVWFWLIPFGDGRSSVGVVGTREFLDSLPGDPASKLQQLVAETTDMGRFLERAEYDSPVSHITGYSTNVASLWGPGFALLGNAGEFLDPVFSSGVTVAMKSASLAVDALDRHLQGEAVDWQAEFADPLQQGVDTFRTYVEGWYDGSFRDIIFYEDKDEAIKAQICSILAGYAWDRSNPYVVESRRRLKVLAKVVPQS